MTIVNTLLGTITSVAVGSCNSSGAVTVGAEIEIKL
jgi:hypothetical protein